MESELFGKDEGDSGKLIDADGGTLFLDEIGDMPLDAQTRLLRVIDGSEPALNTKTGRRPNVRIIAATNRDLRSLIQQGLFREDLFFRLNVAPLRIPPLRDRSEDIRTWPAPSCCAPTGKVCRPRPSTPTRWSA